MPRLAHGKLLVLDEIRAARERLIKASSLDSIAFAVVRPFETHDFDFLFPELQQDPAHLLPEGPATRDALIRLGRAMRDDGRAAGGDSEIPAAYTYLGQFIDHDITLEAVSAELPQLLAPGLAPLPVAVIRETIRNVRSATLDLDSVFGYPAPRDGARMRIGRVTALNGTGPPDMRPSDKDDNNDLPREPRGTIPEHDRAALIGDPRNDENLIVAQLHLAFLRAYNALVDGGMSVREARRSLRRHYQHIVVHDFLKRIADPQIVNETIEQNRIYDAMTDPFFLPLEFSVAAYRFGHSMVRADYNFNANFNRSGLPGTVQAPLRLLFTFTALSGGLGFGQGHDSLPENWIIEWPRMVDAGAAGDRARLIDTRLVEPLFELQDLQGNVLHNDEARLAVRNLLRGYLLRIPTGQAVATALSDRLRGVREIPVLTGEQIGQAAGSEEQEEALREGGFLERTPLWHYVLAEAAALGGGQQLGPVGSTIVAEVIVGLVRRSGTSILRMKDWAPTLPHTQSGTFMLSDLLRLAGVL